MRLEKAIEAMGDSTVPRSRFSRLKRGKVASREAPWAVQVKEYESFIERARTGSHGEWRIQDVTRLAKLVADGGACPTTSWHCDHGQARVDLHCIERCAVGGPPVWFPGMPRGKSSQPRSRQQTASHAGVAMVLGQ